MEKAIIALFKEVDEARSTKVLLESLGVKSEDSHIILKDAYKEELDVLTNYGFSEVDIYNIDKGFKNGSIVLSIKSVSNYQEIVKILIENGSTTIFTANSREKEINNNLNNQGVLENTLTEKNEILKEDLMQKDNHLDLLDLYDEKIKLHEERLNISKEKIQAGEVVLRKEIIEEIRTVTIPVLREELVIEKVDKDNNVQEIERIVLMQEEINIEKVSVIKEKVDIKKIEVQDTKLVTEKLRKEEVDFISGDKIENKVIV